MNWKNNQTMRETGRLMLGLALVLLLLILSACQTQYVPVYLGAEGKAWVLREDACTALMQPTITEDQYRSNKDLRDHVFIFDAKWAAFCEPATQ